MLQTVLSFLVGVMLTISAAIAQTTTDPAAPAAPAGPAAPGAPVDGGGVGDWWWLILLILLIALAIWYFMRKRGSTGRV